MKIIDFAIKRQKAERDFFRKMAKGVSQPGLKAIYSHMARDEEKVLSRFEEMRASGEGCQDSKVLEVLRIRRPSRLNPKRALAVQNDLEAYAYLKEVERGNCRLFSEAAEQEKDGKARASLEKIARAECRASEEMESLYDFANSPNEFLAWGEFSNLDEYYNFGRYADASKALPDKDAME